MLEFMKTELFGCLGCILYILVIRKTTRRTVEEVFKRLYRHIDVPRLWRVFIFGVRPFFAAVVCLFVPSQGDLSLTLLTYVQLINKLTDLPYPSPISSSVYLPNETPIRRGFMMPPLPPAHEIKPPVFGYSSY